MFCADSPEYYSLCDCEFHTHSSHVLLSAHEQAARTSQRVGVTQHFQPPHEIARCGQSVRVLLGVEVEDRHSAAIGLCVEIVSKRRSCAIMSEGVDAYIKRGLPRWN